MGGMIECLKNRERDFTIAGISVQLRKDQMEMKKYSEQELQKKSTSELKVILRDLTKANDKIAEQRQIAEAERDLKDAAKQQAIQPTQENEMATSKSTATKKSATKKSAVKKAAGAAASAIKKSAARSENNTVYQAVAGQHRLNSGSMRQQIVDALTSHPKGMTVAQLETTLPKFKGKIQAGVNALIFVKKVKPA